jgi:Ca2+-binding RTX toxin-like protein
MTQHGSRPHERFGVARLVASIAFSLAALVIPAPALALSQVWVFPDYCPQTWDATLQDCINDAAQGDSIVIATDTPGGFLSIYNKSIDLYAADGYAPEFTNGANVEFNSGTHEFSLRGVSFREPFTINLTGGSGHVVDIDGVGFATSSRYKTALRISASVSSSVTLRRDSVGLTNQGQPIYFESKPAAGQLVSLRAVGDSLTAAGIGGAATDAIAMQVQGAGTTNIDIDNLSVWHVPGAAVALAAAENANVRLNLTGAAIESTDEALFVHDGQMAGGYLTVNMFNSVASHISGLAIWLHESSTYHPIFHFNAGYNDFYAIGHPNQLEGHSLGSHNLAVDPKYVDQTNGDLRLQSDSPLINKGLVCSPSGLADPDAAGNHRLKGTSVDIGAYERGAVAPNGTVVLGSPAGDLLYGTGGDDILCGYNGNDYLYGNGGNDYVDGGSGNDRLYAGTGKDRLYGDLGDDLLCARDGAGGDYLNGGGGTDAYRADSSDTRVSLESAGDCSGG